MLIFVINYSSTELRNHFTSFWMEELYKIKMLIWVWVRNQIHALKMSKIAFQSGSIFQWLMWLINTSIGLLINESHRLELMFFPPPSQCTISTQARLHLLTNGGGSQQISYPIFDSERRLLRNTCNMASITNICCCSRPCFTFKTSPAPCVHSSIIISLTAWLDNVFLKC